jgi:hypothetical protein
MNKNLLDDTRNENEVVLRKKSPSNIPQPINNKRNSCISSAQNIVTPPSANQHHSKLPILKRYSSFSETKTTTEQQASSQIGDKMKQAAKKTTPIKNSDSSSTSMSKFQQFKREQLSKQNSSIINDNSSLSSNPKSMQTLLKQARLSGSLNISNYNLTQIPLSVLRINIDKFEGEENNDDENGFKWWEQIELNKLIIGSNKIKEISKEIEFLDTLITLDVNEYSFNFSSYFILYI